MKFPNVANPLERPLASSIQRIPAGTGSRNNPESSQFILHSGSLERGRSAVGGDYNSGSRGWTFPSADHSAIAYWYYLAAMGFRNERTEMEVREYYKC